MRPIQSAVFLIFVALGWAAETTFATDEVQPESALVVESAEAVAEAVATAVRNEEIQVALKDLTRNRLFRESKVSLELVDMDSGESVFSYGGDMGLMPASTMKVLTSAGRYDAWACAMISLR